MTARRISLFEISGPSGAVAGYRTGLVVKAGASGFRFDPEAWVDFAYPCQETVLAEIGGKKVKRKARFTTEGFHKMISGFEADKARLAAEGVDHALLGNRDHLALTREGGSEAYGWLDGLKVGGDGHLWGHVKWTTLGIEAAAGGVYRFVSIEVKDADGARKPPDAVLEWNQVNGFAVTNQPALELLRPYCHRAGETIEEENEKPKGKIMENLKLILGLTPEATDAEVEAKVKELVEANAAADAATAEAAMSQQAQEFAGKHAKKFTDSEAAMAFYRAAPEKAEEQVGRFRIVEPSVTEAEAALDLRAGEFAAKHSAKFIDEKGAKAFFRIDPDNAEKQAAFIRIPVVAHRGGGNPDELGGDLTPKACFNKWSAMPEGEEKEKFFDAHRVEINAGTPPREAK